MERSSQVVENSHRGQVVDDKQTTVGQFHVDRTHAVVAYER